MPNHRPSPCCASLLAAVERVRPVVLAHADEAEERRTLAQPVVDALRSSGLFAMAAPRAVGGADCDPLTQIDVIEAMTRLDTSAGWSLMISAMISAMAGSYLPDAGVRRIFGASGTGESAFPLFAGLQQPQGLARRAPGGFVVSGRWPFGSGIRHADWVFTGAVVAPEEGASAPPGPPSMISFAVPASRVCIEDTWHTSGLKGSGSEHYRMEDVFVPEELTCAFPGAAPRRGGPQFSLPIIALLAPAHIAFALGAARGALDEISLTAPKRVKIWPGTPLGQHAAFHMDLGRAEAKLAAARAYAFDVVGTMQERAIEGGALTLSDWSAIRVATTYVTEIAADVASFAFRSGGGTALYTKSPLQRYLRDINAAAQHIAATDDAYEFAGRVRLGLPSPHPLLTSRALA
jgi:alkylation response protein AidB-like acyl-CoA dehydrogenase